MKFSDPKAVTVEIWACVGFSFMAMVAGGVQALDIYSRAGVLFQGDIGFYSIFDASFVIQFAFSVIELVCGWIVLRNTSEQGAAWKRAPLLLACLFTVWCLFAAAIEVLFLGGGITNASLFSGWVGQSLNQWTLCVIAVAGLRNQRRALEEAVASSASQPYTLVIEGRVFTEIPPSELWPPRPSPRRRA